MAETEDPQSKTHEPTPRKLQKAREEGQNIRSEELQACTAVLGFALAFWIWGATGLDLAATQGKALFANADVLRLQKDDLLLWSVSLQMGQVFFIPIGLAAICVLLWLCASKAILFTPSKLGMRPDRLSLIANFSQKFGRGGWVDFFKRCMKLTVFSLLALAYGNAELPFLQQSMGLASPQIALLLLRLCLTASLAYLCLLLLFGGLDYLWQRYDFLRRHRMSLKEVMDELRESEGDPQQKADRRQRGQEIAKRQLVRDIPLADVVIVNPLHFAVALKWDRGAGRAPICVAKGQDEMAAQIRHLARQAGIPIQRDPATARALYAVLQVGDEVPTKHYRAVAAAIRFADAMRRKAKQQGQAR